MEMLKEKYNVRLHNINSHEKFPLVIIDGNCDEIYPIDNFQ